MSMHFKYYNLFRVDCFGPLISQDQDTKLVKIRIFKFIPTSETKKLVRKNNMAISYTDGGVQVNFKKNLNEDNPDYFKPLEANEFLTFRFKIGIADVAARANYSRSFEAAVVPGELPEETIGPNMYFNNLVSENPIDGIIETEQFISINESVSPKDLVRFDFNTMDPDLSFDSVDVDPIAVVLSLKDTMRITNLDLTIKEIVPIHDGIRNDMPFGYMEIHMTQQNIMDNDENGEYRQGFNYKLNFLGKTE